MKRYLYIIVAVAAVALIVLIILYFMRSASVPPLTGTTGNLPSAPTQNNPRPSNTTPPPAFAPNGATGSLGKKFGVVGQNQVLDFYVDAQNNAVLVQPGGQIVKIAGNNTTVLSSSAIVNLINASFSYDGNKILAEFGDPSNPRFSIFDIPSKSWQPLSFAIDATTWSPSTNQIAYLAPKGDAETISTLDVSNAKAKPTSVAAIHVQDITLNWVNPSHLLLVGRGSALVPASVWNLDLTKKTLAPLITDASSLDSLWSGKAQMGLVFAADPNNRGGALTIYDAAGNALKKLSFLTLPSKCAFDTTVLPPLAAIAVPSASTSSGRTSAGTKTNSTSTAKIAAPVVQNILYCAVPRDDQKLKTSQLPDEYEQKVFFTADDFYKTNLGDGVLNAVFSDQNQILDATDMKVFNQTLFFVNRIDQKLYAISLK